MAGAIFKSEILSLPPEEAQAMVAGFVASVLGQLPDEFWQLMLENSGTECGVPDCDCHKLGQLVFPALDALRTDYKEQTGFN